MLNLEDKQYDTTVRNRRIKVSNPKVQYTDQLTGYKYEHGGRVYFQTIAHGYVERSHFRWDKPNHQLSPFGEALRSAGL